MRVKCALNARQVRVNLVPESARHLQMTRTPQMRVICVRVRVKYLRPKKTDNLVLLVVPNFC